MASGDLVDTIMELMRARNVSQSALARECGLSQPHLSRVLHKQLKIGAKTRLKLENWLADLGVEAASDAASAPTLQELQKLVGRLGGSPKRRMHIMHLLQAIEAMVAIPDVDQAAPTKI